MTPNPHRSDWDIFWTHTKQGRPAGVSWSKKRMLARVARHIAPGKKILDAGCGSGFFSGYFCDQGMSTTALDYSSQALTLTKAATEGRARIIQEDLTDPALPKRLSEQFDVIFSDGLLEHFSRSDQDVILANFAALLARDGVVMTFVPNRFSPWQLVRPLMMPGIHETPFVLRTLVSVQKEAGFDIVEAGGLNVFPWACSPERLLGRWFGMLLYTVARR